MPLYNNNTRLTYDIHVVCYASVYCRGKGRLDKLKHGCFSCRVYHGFKNLLFVVVVFLFCPEDQSAKFSM